MKYIFTTLILFIMTTAAVGQKDFDYSFYTTHAAEGVDTSDEAPALQLTLMRMIRKENNTLKIISLNNTADVIEYKLQYIGYQPDNGNLYYQDEEKKCVIKVLPILGIIEITRHIDGSGDYVYRFY